MRRLLSKKEAAELVGIHPESLMRLVRQGAFPAPIKLGDRAGSYVRFDEGEIEQWYEERRTARVASAPVERSVWAPVEERMPAEVITQ